MGHPGWDLYPIVIDPGARPGGEGAGRDCPGSSSCSTTCTGAGEEQLLDRELTPAALVTLLLLKTARGNPRIAADLRRWAGHLRAVLDQPGGRGVHRVADVH